jgi:hypothetical protein
VSYDKLILDSDARALNASTALWFLFLSQPCIFSKQAPAATMGYKGSQPCCETGKPVYDGIVTTRLQRKAGAADGSRAGTAN